MGSKSVYLSFSGTSRLKRRSASFSSQVMAFMALLIPMSDQVGIYGGCYFQQHPFCCYMPGLLIFNFHPCSFSAFSYHWGSRVFLPMSTRVSRLENYSDPHRLLSVEWSQGGSKKRIFYDLKCTTYGKRHSLPSIVREIYSHDPTQGKP